MVVCLTLSYVQGGWKHSKERFTVMKKNPEFKSRQASDIGQGEGKGGTNCGNFKIFIILLNLCF